MILLFNIHFRVAFIFYFSCFPLSKVMIDGILFSRRWDFKDLILVFKLNWLETGLHLGIFLNFRLHLLAIYRRNVHVEYIPEQNLKYYSSVFCFAWF